MFDRLRAILGNRLGRPGRAEQPSPPVAGSSAQEPGTANPVPSDRIDRAAATIARWSFRIIAVSAALYIGGWLVQQTWSLLLPLALALLLSTILWMPMQVLRRVLPSGLAALLSLLGFLAGLAGIVWLLVPRIAAQGGQLIGQLYAAADNLRGFLSGPPLNLGSNQISDMLDRTLDQIQKHQQDIATGVITGVSSLGAFLVNFVLVLFLTFFILKDGPRFLPWSHRWLPDRSKAHFDTLAVRIWKMLTGFIWSQAAVALVDAVLIGIGLVVLDIPFALPISVTIFFASFIPIVGAIATGVLATLVALIDQGIWIALAVLLIVLVVQQVESNLLQPFLVGRTLSLHPAVVLGSVTVGGTVFGIVGAFLAVPTAATAITALRYAREQAARTPPERPRPGGPAAAAASPPD